MYYSPKLILFFWIHPNFSLALFSYDGNQYLKWSSQFQTFPAVYTSLLLRASNKRNQCVICFKWPISNSLPFGIEAFSFIHIKMTENSESGKSHHWDIQMPIQPILVLVLNCILKVRYWTNFDWAIIIMAVKGEQAPQLIVFYISHQRVIGPISNCCFKDSLK